MKTTHHSAAALLATEHVVPLRPKGKPRMREWVQINRTRVADYELDMVVFLASIDFVGTLVAKEGSDST